MTTKLMGASVWEEALYEHLTSHEGKERELLVEYKQAATSSGSLAFEYLASLIIEDEIRHHRMFKELASALRTDAEFRPEPPAIPRLDHWGADTAQVIELTSQLLRREHDDADELHHLARQLKDIKDTTLWQLLIKVMEMDTAKHIAILEFVKSHARKER